MAIILDQQYVSEFTSETVRAILNNDKGRPSMYLGKPIPILSHIILSICHSRPENPSHFIKNCILIMKAELIERQNTQYETITKEHAQMRLLKQALSLHPIFEALEETKMDAIVEGFAAETYKAGTTLIKAGDRCRKFYIIVSGRVEMRRDGELSCITGKGSTFGELCLIYDRRFAQTVVAITDLRVWEIPTEIYRTILLHDMESPIPKYMYEHVPKVLQKLVFNDGCVVVNKHECVENFYIIKSGIALVTEHTAEQANDPRTQKDNKTRRLKQRDYFGEVPLVYNCPSGLEIVAEGRLVCYVLNKAYFNRFIGKWFK